MMELRPEPYEDPVIKFVVGAVQLSLSLNKMSREQAEEAVKRWYPEAEIVLED